MLLILDDIFHNLLSVENDIDEKESTEAKYF